ncbi:MAG: hypothetical protein ACO1TE_04830 [Prosthecobacter sp.]
MPELTRLRHGGVKGRGSEAIILPRHGCSSQRFAFKRGAATDYARAGRFRPGIKHRPCRPGSFPPRVAAMFHRFLLGACLGLLIPLSALAQLPAEPAQPKVRLQLLKDSPKVDAPTSQELLAWLTTLQNVVYRMNIRDYLEMVDWDALIETSYADNEARLDKAKMARMKNALMVVHQRMFPVIRPFFLFINADVLRIDVAEGKAVIVARVWDGEGLESKVRWWLRRDGQEWKMADYEVITVNMRLSFLLFMGIQTAETAPLLSKEISQKFILIGNAIEEGEIEKAYTLIKEFESSKLPAILDEVFLVAKAGVLSQMPEKAHELETALDRLEKIAPTSPVLYLLRAAGCHGAADHEGTIAWCQKLGASIGHDEETWMMLMESHQKLKQDKEAAAVAQAWAEDYPNSVHAVWFCWELLPEDQREIVVKPLLEKMQPAEQKLETFAEDAFDDDDVDALKLVIAVMQSRSLPPGTVKDWQKDLEMLEEMIKEAK